MTAPRDKFYTLNGVAHRQDEVAQREHRGGGVMSLCGEDLRWYGVYDTPHGNTVCPTCELAYSRPGESPVTPGEYETSIDEEVDRFLAVHPMHDREAVTGSLTRARQADCRHEGRTLDGEDEKGNPILTCAQCDMVLMDADDMLDITASFDPPEVIEA